MGDRALPHGNMINGSWEPTTGPEREVTDPATGAVLAVINDADAGDVDRAVLAAQDAFSGWWSDGLPRRARAMRHIADLIAANGRELALIETLDTGKPLAQSETDVAMAEQYFRFYAEAASHLFGDVIPSKPHLEVRTEREPFGVIGHITPWNAPISQLTRGVAPSLAVGNTVVVKPSELAPLSSIFFAELVREALPAGVFNLIIGDGATAGAALAGHPRIDHLTFTGSVRTGRTVSKSAADNLVATNLELGGKSPAIVFPDADLPVAAQAATNALIRNSGQSCSALTRFLVHRDVEAEFTQLVLDNVRKLTVGPGVDGHDVGPLITASQRDRVLELVQRAIESGAELLIGSAAAPGAPGLSAGTFAAPTVLRVHSASEIARTEVFGPVQCIIPFDSAADALEIANDSDYGLAAAVFTNDLRVASRFSREIHAGQVQINGFIGAGMEIPFGGYKHSGHGREKGFEALIGYTQVKAIVTHHTLPKQ
ncbi:aldehyde dehydrogenase [Leucobacter sp. Psy1]|nr:aldehyde dehydrogenase [Leucobacter sp. Psy1]